MKNKGKTVFFPSKLTMLDVRFKNISAIWGTKNKADAILENIYLLMLNKELHHFPMLNKYSECFHGIQFLIFLISIHAETSL